MADGAGRAAGRRDRDQAETPVRASVSPILQTKLRPPQVVSDLVARPHLLEVLQQNPRRPMTLVAAPAGYGKTTLVTQWLHTTAGHSAWLSLSEEDGELRTFLRYLVAAVRTQFPGACSDTLALVEAGQLPRPSVLADALNNDVEGIDQPFILVLDDFHCVDDTDVHELIESVLRYPPRPLHLVLTTRHDPPISLASLRARGWLTEIRQEDLRFSKSEVRTVLERIAAVSVSEHSLSHLEEEIEGWIVGLHLVGLMLRNQPDPEGFLSGLKGGFQQVHDYLLEEVLASQSEFVRDGLLTTSLLDRFCAPLVEALCCTDGDTATSGMTGQSFIQSVQRNNLFANPLDASGHWFRYHHMFRDLLRRQLELRHTASDIGSLHQRASTWFESQGLITESIEHALAAGDDMRAAEIIETHRHQEFFADRWYVVERWLAMLAPEVKQERPKLLLTEAWIANCRHQLPRIPPIVDKVETLISGQQLEQTVAAELALFKGILACWEGRADSSRQYLEQSASRFSGSTTPFAAETELYLGIARCMAGDKERAIQALEERVGRIDLTEGLLRSRLIAGIVFAYLVSGELAQARTEAEQLRHVAKKHGIRNTEAWSHYLLASAHLNAGDFSAAPALFANAVDQRYVFEPAAAIDAFAGLSLSLQLLGRDDEAWETADRLQEFAAELNERPGLNSARSCRARLSLLRGDMRSAMTWAPSLNEPILPASSFIWLEVPAITQARVLIAAGTAQSLAEASDLLEAMHDLSERCRFTCQGIEVAALRPLLLKKQDRTEEALQALNTAIALAEPGRWVRPFVEAGRPMAELLRELPTQHVSSEFVNHLLDTFPESTSAEAAESARVAPETAPVSSPKDPLVRSKHPAGAASKDADPGISPLVESLTNRELDTLHLMAERLYDKEIAKALSVSVWTVRTHVKHIFEKLHVSNRRQAVIKAEELGLLKDA